MEVLAVRVNGIVRNRQQEAIHARRKNRSTLFSALQKLLDLQRAACLMSNRKGTGGPPAAMTPEQIAEYKRQALERYRATHAFD